MSEMCNSLLQLRSYEGLQLLQLCYYEKNKQIEL